MMNSTSADRTVKLWNLQEQKEPQAVASRGKGGEAGTSRHAIAEPLTPS